MSLTQRCGEAIHPFVGIVVTFIEGGSEQFLIE